MLTSASSHAPNENAYIVMFVDNIYSVNNISLAGAHAKISLLALNTTYIQPRLTEMTFLKKKLT